jgi:hypothetical protein
MGLQRASLARLPAELFGARAEHVLALLSAAWPAAVGPELARRTEVVTLEAGTLKVRVPDASWRAALHRMREPILSRLAAVAGSLAPRRLGFMEAPAVTARGKPPLLKTKSPAATLPPPAPPPGLTEAAAVIDDPELRRRFLDCAARYLGRRAAGPGEAALD